MNLMYLAQSGLSTAQAALNVVGNNLTNAATPGYSRQVIMPGEAGGKSTQYGFFGYGVKVDDARRVYDSFLSNQVRGAATAFNTLQSRYQQASQIDDMLGDSTHNISTTLNDGFNAMEAVSKDPVDPSARQGVLSAFEAVASQFRSNSKTLNDLAQGTSTQIEQSVSDINVCTRQLAEINRQVEKVHGQTGEAPADLLDQRDRLLGNLSEQIGINVTENKDTGCVNISLENGMSLVNGDESYTLQARPSDKAPDELMVSYVDSSGNALKLDEDSLTGKLGGLFKFQNTDLKDARNQLDQLALQMANKFNVVNSAGYDRNGRPGGDIFSIDAPQAVGNTNNTGNSSLDIRRDDTSVVTAQDYTISYNGSAWEVKDSEGQPVQVTTGKNGELTFDGITVTPRGKPDTEDCFTVNPVSGAAGSINVAITDGDQIAASGSSDPAEQSNNENIRALINIKDDAVVGKDTLTGAYASLVSSVGSSVSALKSDLDTSGKVSDQWALQKQSVSGVDINEEYVNMQMYSQYYQANAQVLQTATTIFDTILNIR